MSLLSQWLKKVLGGVEQKADTLWKNDIEPAVVDAWHLFKSTFVPAAEAAVAKFALAEFESLTSGQKADGAGKELQLAIKAAGWSASTTAVSTLIQEAYLNLKADRGDVIVIPPPGGAS